MATTQTSFDRTDTARLKAKPVAAGIMTGLIASLCCGGSLIFASIGLGVFYSGLGLARYIPQALAAGAISIVAINYLFYRHVAKHQSGNSSAPRRKMFISAAVGLVVMAGSFVFMEWLNHAVVHADRFLAHSAYSQALIKGVPNATLLYVGATFFALTLLWALPFPGAGSSGAQHEDRITRTVRVGVIGVTTILLIGVLLDATSKSRVAGTVSSQHGQAH